MAILDQLATSLNQRDEAPNLALAQKIADANDKAGVQELFVHLDHKNRNIQRDCIKVIYEIAMLKPVLVADFVDALIALLDSKKNRLQWGAMTALDAITLEKPADIFDALPKIMEVANKGSVITNDHCVAILLKLCSLKEYAATAFSLFDERLLASPTNQLPMYAENALPIINDNNRAAFASTLSSRLGDIDKESKRKRVEKVLKKLSK